MIRHLDSFVRALAARSNCEDRAWQRQTDQTSVADCGWRVVLGEKLCSPTPQVNAWCSSRALWAVA